MHSCGVRAIPALPPLARRVVVRRALVPALVPRLLARALLGEEPCMGRWGV